MEPGQGVLHILHFLQPPTTELSHFLAGNNQLVVCNGANPSWKKGTLIKDLGYSKIGSTINSGKAITGLFNFRQTASTQKMLATINDSTGADLELYYSTGGAWTEIAAAQTAWAGYEDSLVEMESFIGYCFFVGYDSTDNVFLPVGSLTNTTFSTSTNVTSMPQAKYITRYRDRLYVANAYTGGTAYPYRVYYSSIPSAGAITWTPASDFFDVDFSEQITGLSSNWDRLVIFTEFSAYIYDQDSEKQVWETGCVNNRSIQNEEGYMFWASDDNVWVSTSGRPQAIGNDIKELILQADPTKFRSAMVNREYNLYLGATQANGIAYTNCLATFNIELGMWRWRETYDDMTALALRTTGNEEFLWMGTATGDVMVKSKYTDATQVFADNTHSIVSHFRTRAYDLGDPSVIKAVSKIVAYSEVANGLELQYRIFDKNQETLVEFGEIGQLKTTIETFNFNARGYFIQLEGREYSSNAPWKFNGFSILYNPETSL